MIGVLLMSRTIIFKYAYSSIYPFKNHCLPEFIHFSLIDLKVIPTLI
jgi:hypothetical protein